MCVGLVTQIPQDLFEFLHALEERLTHTIKSVGKISHTFWRSFNTDIKTEPAEGFIDGDLIESFLDLSRETMAETVQGLQVIHSRDHEINYSHQEIIMCLFFRSMTEVV